MKKETIKSIAKILKKKEAWFETCIAIAELLETEEQEDKIKFLKACGIKSLDIKPHLKNRLMKHRI